MIAHNINSIDQQIRAVAVKYNRNINEIRLLAVSKTQPVQAIRDAYTAGQRAFGENYIQEALEKIEQLPDLAIEWHFIGPIQSNKTKPIAENMAWVHTVDRLKVAERLSAQRPKHLPDLNCCIQVNVMEETSKSGVRLQELPDLAEAVAALPRLKLRGLMTVPPAEQDVTKQRAPFRLLHEAKERLALPLDTLSMGMTNDMEAAIAEGSTMLRIGRAIFGERG